MWRNIGKRSRGNSCLEFTLVGIPLICILITTFEMARGMWLYETLTHAVKAGVRYSVVHGQNCAIDPNHCTVAIKDIAQVIQDNGPGLATNSVTLTFLDAKGGSTVCALSSCLGNNTMFPPDGANAQGQRLTIRGTFPFHSAMLFFWPGTGKGLAPPGTINLSADSRESIQY